MHSEERFFCSLSSGSSGNCYYLGTKEKGILIDAGIAAGSIRKFLRSLDIPLQALMGVLISHNHTDHTRGLELLTRKHYLPVYTTDRIWQSILSRKVDVSAATVHKMDLHQCIQLAGFEIEAFPVDHDAPETVGFHVRSGEKKLTLATDLGHISPDVAPYLEAAHLLVIESNYDEKMLMDGGYPYFLKARILSDKGHLGNRQTADFLAKHLGNEVQHICLAHLSKNNNTPDLALQAMHDAFAEKGLAINGHPQISVLKRHGPSEVIRLDS